MENFKSNKIPTAQKEIEIKPKKKRRFLIVKIFIAIFFVLCVVSAVLLYIVFTSSVLIVDKFSTKTEIVQDDSISKEEAEARTLDSTNYPNIALGNFEQTSKLNEEKFPYITTNTSSIDSIQIDENGLITRAKTTDSTDIFYFTEGAKKELKVSNSVLAELISTFVKEENIKNFELDVHFTNLDQFEGFLNQLKLNLVGYQYKLGLYIYPKWGDFVDYKFYSTITNDNVLKGDLNKIVNSVDYVKVLSFDYTGPMDILPGSITPSQWFKRIVQYFRYNQVDVSKVYMGINTSAYKWPEREIAHTSRENFTVFAQEAEVVPRREFEKIIESGNFEKIVDDKIEEDIYKIEELDSEGKLVSKIVIFPNLENISSLESLASSYGFKGVFYK